VKPIPRGEILDIEEYEEVREPFRARVLAEKKLRRVALGDKATAPFENRDTGDNELSCTVMIEIPGAAERDEFLALAHGFERHVAILVGGDTVRASWEIERELPDRASRGDVAVTRVDLIVDHPAYAARVSLPVDTIVSLGEDLAV
jgi:hypothetical protein